MSNISIENIVKALSQELQQPLPGWEAQRQMATELHKKARVVPRPDARKAAVLILLFPSNRQLHLPLILRPVYAGVHSGQMALPGGKVESRDVDLIDTALRETGEEIGIWVERQQVLGQLSELYIFPSNIRVAPVVAYIPAQPQYVPDPTEVAAVVNVPVEVLNNPQYQTTSPVTVVGGATVEAPAYKVEGRIVWGATAMMLSEFLTVWNKIF